MNDTWEWDGGRLERRVTIELDWPAALADQESEVTGLSIQWTGGGFGHEPDGDCKPVSGATLLAWTGLGWETLDESEGHPSTPHLGEHRPR